MSEESIDSLVTPEKIELGNRNISTLSAERSVSPSHGRSTSAFCNRVSVGSLGAGNSATRNSTGKSGFFKGNQTVRSRYLRASTGSCHDHCKSGVKYSFEEEKFRTPLRRRQVKPLPVELEPVRTKEDEQKHVKVFNHKPASDTKAKLPYLKTQPDTNSPSPNYGSSSDMEKAVKHRLLTDSRNDHRKLKTSLDAETTPVQKRTTLLKNKPSSSKKVSSPDPPEIIKSIILSSENYAAKVEQRSSTASEMPRSGRKKISPSSQHSPVNSTPVKDRPVLSSGRSDVRGKERKNSDTDSGRNLTVPRTSAKKILSPPANSLPPKVSPVETGSTRSRKAENSKLLSSPEVQNRSGRKSSSTSNDEKVLEKALHVVNTEAGNNISASISDAHVISSFSSPSAPKSEKHISDNDESLENGNALPIPNDLAVSLSQAESPSLLPTEEDRDRIEYDDGERGEFIHENDESLEIDNVQSVLNAHEGDGEQGGFIHENDQSLEIDNVQSVLNGHEGDGEQGGFIHENDESLEIDNVQSVLNGHEGDGEQGGFIHENDESLEIDNVQSVLNGHDVSSFLSSLSTKSEAESSLSPHEEDKKDINGDESDSYICGNDKSLEIGNMLAITGDHAVPLFPSSPRSSSSLSPHERDNKGIECRYSEQDQFITDNEESREINNVLSALDDCTVSLLPSPVSEKPLSSHEEDNKEINYHGDEPHEYVSENGEENGNVQSVPTEHSFSSLPLSPHEVDNKEINYQGDEPHEYVSENGEENGNVQSVPTEYSFSSLPLSPHEVDNKEINYHDEDPHEYISENSETQENGNVQTVLDGNTISSSIPSPPKSLSHADLSSLSPHEEQKEEIEYHDSESSGEYISENDEPPEIGNMQPNHNGRTGPSLPRPLSCTDFSSVSSLGEEDDDEEIEYIDGELDGITPDKEEYMENDDLHLAGENPNKAPRSRIMMSEDQEDCSPVKLKFKPGRVIDPNKSDNNGPRKLRFRRGRALSAENARSGLRTLKRSGSTGHISVDELSSEKVVLKHQDVQDKKDSQILLNNVIEETASKLVRSRKSKVKALVGAFETVISLQESKPSS